MGGVATLAYIEGRNTQDVDLIIPRSALLDLPEIAIEEEKGEFARAKLDSLQIDLRFTDHKLFQLVASEYSSTIRFASREVNCATGSGLGMLKLYSLPALYRQGNFD